MTSLAGPLVEPGTELTHEELVRYSRHLSLTEIGEVGQRRLKNARVLVIGAGGLGSPILLYLAAAGVGTIGIVDDDDVDISNLQRQIAHSVAEVGRAKVDSAADTVARLNPLITVNRHRARLGADNAVDIISDYDLVLDGADNFATRYLVSDACTLTAVPCIWGSILRFDGRVSVFWDNPGHDGISYRDLHPDMPAPGQVPSCSTAGVIGALPGTIGSMMAAEAVKLITGTGSSLYGRLLIHDSAAMTFRELVIKPDPMAPPITEVGVTSSALSACSPTAPLEIDPAQLSERLAAGAVLIDVREPWEREIVSIPAALSVPLSELQEHGADALPEKAKGHDIIFHCRSGQRSAQAVNAVASFYSTREETASHLGGGILAWVNELHPELPSY